CALVMGYPPSAPLLPYTTLFRSGLVLGLALGGRRRARTARASSRQQRARRDCCPREAHVRRRRRPARTGGGIPPERAAEADDPRSEEHTSELQSRENLVCRLLLQ